MGKATLAATLTITLNGSSVVGQSCSIISELGSRRMGFL